jgi:hypothetical protein
LSAKAELEKLRVMRKELEAESSSLIEKQQKLRKEVWVLEEQVIAQELKKEKALVEDLRYRNEVAKSTIAELEAKKKELETKLGKMTPTPEEPAQLEKADETSEQTEADPEENGVTITVVESEEMIETQENQQEKEKFRFF